MASTNDVLERVESCLDALNQELAGGQSEALRKFLGVLAKFHRYSFNNFLLIAMQKPDATRVAGFHAWKQFGRSVKKGEKGIAILAPSARRRTVDEEDGEPSTIRVVTGFKAVYVFDVSQTEGEELPPFAGIYGDPGAKIERLEAIIQDDGITLEYDAHLYCEGVSMGGRIVVKEGLAPAERFSVLAHELGHEWLHRGERRHETTKTVRETEAEAVAYVVCRACGLDPSTRSSDYIHLYRVKGTNIECDASWRIWWSAMRPGRGELFIDEPGPLPRPKQLLNLTMCRRTL
jgi:antirestriction protein ArdC